MLKFLLACALLAVVSAQQGGQSCRGETGVGLTTMGGGSTPVMIACKFDFIRGQGCGKWRISLTPGLRLTRDENGEPTYVMEKLTIGVNDTSDNTRKVKLRFDQNTLRQFRSSEEEKAKKNGKNPGTYPFKERKGTTKNAVDDFFNVNLFNANQNEDDNTLVIESSDGAYRFTFMASNGRIDLNSSVYFECFHNMSVKESDDQMCSWDNFPQDNDARILHHIFMSSVQQSGCECKQIKKAMTKHCKKSDKDWDAALNCARLVYDKVFLKCAIEHGIVPKKAFRACVEVMCRGEHYLHPCDDLRVILNTCPEFSKPPPATLYTRMGEKCVGTLSWPPMRNLTDAITSAP